MKNELPGQPTDLTLQQNVLCCVLIVLVLLIVPLGLLQIISVDFFQLLLDFLHVSSVAHQLDVLLVLGHGVEEPGVQGSVVLLQRSCLVEVDQLRHAVELIWRREAVLATLVTDLHQLVAAALPEGESVLTTPTAGVTDQERPVWRLLQLLVDLLPSDVPPVPLGLQQCGVPGPAGDGAPSFPQGGHCDRGGGGEVMLGEFNSQSFSHHVSLIIRRGLFSKTEIFTFNTLQSRHCVSV